MVTLWMEWFSSVMADIRNGMTCARYIAGRNSADCVESNASVGVCVSDGPKWLRRVLTGINGAPQCGRGVRPDEGDLPLRHLCDGQRQRDDDKRRRAMSCALTCVFGMHVRVCRHSLGDVQMRHLRPKLGAERLFGMCCGCDQHQAKQHRAPKSLNRMPISAAENPHSAFPLHHIQSGPDCAG